MFTTPSCTAEGLPYSAEHQCFVDPFSNFNPAAGQERDHKYRQSLWEVHDDLLDAAPEDRFRRTRGVSPLCEAVIESGADGPLSCAPITEGLKHYVEHAARLAGCPGAEYAACEDVITRVFWFLDYTEPYFLFWDAPVEVSSDHLNRIYKTKNGETLDPEKVECFKVVPGYGFDRFKKFDAALNHAVTQAVSRTGVFVHYDGRTTTTRRDVLKGLGEILFGTHYAAFVDHFIEEWLLAYYDDLEEHMRIDQEGERFDTEAAMENDRDFWYVVALASLAWLLSPHALRFLIEYHPIYDAVLAWNTERNHPVVSPDGGEAVVHEWDIFPASKLHVIEAAPGTCERCKEDLHCTKYLNARALFQNDCSCSVQDADPVDTDFYAHDWDCRIKTTAFFAFVCHKCVADTVTGSEQPKCPRAICPALRCPWHLGADFRARALTARRTRLLTASTGK